MAQTERSEIERMLQEKFPQESPRFTSMAKDPETSTLVKELARPVEERGRIPMTREAFVIEEPPARVEWEREIRIFLSRLSQESGHRVTAPMIYEWTTGISIRQLAEEALKLKIEEARKEAEAKGKDFDESTITLSWRGGGTTGPANMHLRLINWVLKEYFGNPHKTTIAGRSVGRAYTVRKYFRVRDKKPANLTLIPDWEAGTLDGQ